MEKNIRSKRKDIIVKLTIIGLGFFILAATIAAIFSQFNVSNEVSGPIELNYTYKNGTVTGPKTASVKQDNDVTIRLNSDKAEEIHLHGYDKMVEVEPNEPAELKFNAMTAGQFEFELEDSGQQLGTLTVQPK